MLLMTKFKHYEKYYRKTIISCLVSLKCNGYFGKSFTPLTKKERLYVVETLIDRGYLDEKLNVLPKAKNIITENLQLNK